MSTQRPIESSWRAFSIDEYRLETSLTSDGLWALASSHSPSENTHNA